MFFPGDPLNYPANSISSIRRYESDRDPNNFDTKNFNLGDEWLNNLTNDWFKLASKANGSAVWCNLCASISGDPIDFLLTDDGPPAVGPDAAGITSLLGGNGITTSGQDPLTAVTVDLDAPVSVPNGGTGNTSLVDHSVLVGNGVNPITQLPVGTDGQVLLGATGIDPVFSNLTSTDSLLNFVEGSGTLDILAQNAVSAASPLTDEAVLRGDGGDRGARTSTVLISDAGEMTNPSQPAFFARNNANQNNITGAGTAYTIRYQNEVFDQAGDYDGTDTFTAPVAGNYMFSATSQITSLGASAEGVQLSLDSSTIDKRCSVLNGEFGRSGASNTMLSNAELFINLDAADTCFVTIQVDGMPGDTVDMSSLTGHTFGALLTCS